MIRELFSSSHSKHIAGVLAAMALLSAGRFVAAGSVESYKPQYLPPGEILQIIGTTPSSSGGTWTWGSEDAGHSVEIHLNQAANLLLLTGEASDLAYALEFIKKIDVSPRQIVIDAHIVEVNESKSREIGLDWDRILRDGLPRGSVQFRDDHQSSDRWDATGITHQRVDTDSRSLNATSSFNFGEALRLMDESGTGSIRNAPRVLTLNNRRATILDGQRVTYVTRYSSYTNLFVTDSMDAGLTLSVSPSLGESGYLTLDVNAELTSLVGDISGSPVKDGQIIQNTVIVRDGESVMLGGFERSVDTKSKRRFPLLGHILPFLFSREVTNKTLVRSYVILTPHVVDLAGVVDAASPEALPKQKE
jgi:type II secretory pathway component GspD/PulD (secretin)